MCYNVASPKKWQEIFNICSIDDIRNTIKDIALSRVIREGHGQEGWNTDQQILYKKVMEWNEATQNLVCLKEATTGFCRLDRETFVLNDQIQHNISNGTYSDYHCFRPMSEYRKINEEIYELL